MAKTNSFKRNNLFSYTQASQHQREPILSQNRNSVMQNYQKESLSQVAGINHLSDKRNSGLLTLSKNQQSLSLKKEQKLTIDYYTVQNNKTSPSNPGSNLPSQRQVSHQPSNRQNTQNSGQKSQRAQYGGMIQSPTIKQPTQISIRNSIKTEHRKQRAISNTKHIFNNFLHNASTSQNFSKKLPQKQIPGNYQNAYNDGSSTGKSARKHQVSFGNKIPSSPLPLQMSVTKQSSSKMSNPYRSPQHSNKTVGVFSESCSPLPTKITSSQALTSIKQYPSQSKISKKPAPVTVNPMKKPENSKAQNTKMQKPGNNITNSNTNCLSIDLSNLTTKNENTLESYRDHTVATSTINLAPKTSKTTYLKQPVGPKKGTSSIHTNKKKTPNEHGPIRNEKKESKRSFKDDSKSKQFIQVKEQKKVPDSTHIKTNKITLIERKDFDRQENISAHINHTYENEENNNIPEIHSLNSLQEKDEMLLEEQKIEVTVTDTAEFSSFPMSKSKFVQLYKELLFDFEIEELQKLKIDNIYFAGFVLSRTEEELKLLRGQSEPELIKELDDEEGYYNLLSNDHLIYRYKILKVLGKGSFAQVVSCIDMKTGKKVAIKVTRNTELDHKFAQSESRLLNFLMQKDPLDNHNIVRMQDEFFFREHHCFVFELLHCDLFEHLKENGFIGFPTAKIRDYAIQILRALIFLEENNLIHCDLKPENILLRDQTCNTLKLVDYGSGCFRDEQVYTYVQSRFYRAPEVILRLRYTEKVDIWSLGCILVELYTGEPLFPGNNEQEQLELIMEICGIPPPHVIDQSRKKDYYFDTDYSPFLIEEDDIGILRIPESKTLEQVMQCRDPYFVDFIKCCIDLDPEVRFSAKQAMEHHWIKEGLTSTSMLHPNQRDSMSGRQREDDEEGAKGIALEESPHKIVDKPKVSLNKILNFNLVNDKHLPGEIDETESLGSTPGSEGNLDFGDRAQSQKKKESAAALNSVVQSEKGVKKPNQEQISNKRNEFSALNLQNQVEFVGKYEISREDEPITPINESPPNESQSFGEIKGKVEPDQITCENTINKITVTVYQRRNTGNKHGQQTSGSQKTK